MLAWKVVHGRLSDCLFISSNLLVSQELGDETSKKNSSKLPKLLFD
jgi:hypothetical protein